MATRNDVMRAVTERVENMVFPTPINSSGTWKTVSNKLRLWADVPPDQQPCAFVVTHREMDEYRTLGAVRRRLELGIWCYSRADSVSGAEDLDTMMEAFDTAFGAAAADNNSTGQLTFNDLVYWCRIEGRVFKDPGDIDSQTLLIVPLIIEMP